MKNRYLAVSAIACSIVLAEAAQADFSYTETTQITGGSMLGMMKMAGAFSRQARQASGPITSTIIVQGNRMIQIGQDRAEIIDLDKGTITELNTARHEYTVVTFEQMRQQMEAAMAKAKAESAKAQPAPAAAAAAQPAAVDVSFEVHVRNTGASKEVAGLRAQESIMTLAIEGKNVDKDGKNVDSKDKKGGETGSLAFTNDMWLAPEIPGYNEVRDFYARYALKMGTVYSGAGAALGATLMTQPGAAQGMQDMAREVSKMKGIPVLQVMRMGMTANGAPLPAASEAPLPAGNGQAMPTAGEVGQQVATSAIANTLGLGGFGFGRKKKAEAAPEQVENSNAAAAAAAAVLMESSTEVSSFSQAPVDSSKFDIPAGYKQVPAKNLN